MKKLILAFATVALISLGGAPAFAQDGGQPPDEYKVNPDASLPLPVECSEADTISDFCLQFYVAISVKPPPPTTAPATTAAPLSPTNNLPTTGSGVSSVLGIGALLVLAGGLITVAARRRSTASSPAA